MKQTYQRPNPYLAQLYMPRSGDERAMGTVMQHYASGILDNLKAALPQLHGGGQFNFETPSTVAPRMMATPAAAPESWVPEVGQTPQGINIDPSTLAAFLWSKDPYHDFTSLGVVHELAHLSQTPDVLAADGGSVKEGGAQAFADQYAPAALAKAGVSFGGDPSRFDGIYRSYVAQALARGPQWIGATQFGG